ncbi:non-ribosomal peptide synthetase, partial [Micromonospora sp. CPCC 205371]|nr:non-ribosomal peptide synthetase [Micromonospora sp. CPCC 205371]
AARAAGEAALTPPAAGGGPTWHSAEPVTDGERPHPLRPLNPAYAIYTSGSTGGPKGVVISHRGLVDFIRWAVEDLGAETFAHTLASISTTFDPSVLEMFAPLCSGGCVEVLSGPLALGERRWTGSFATSVPSVFSTLAVGSGLDLRIDTIGMTGEALSPRVVEEMRAAAPGCRVANLYGPTEVTVYSTSWLSTDPVPDGPPVGAPLTNTRLYVLDDELRPVPVGVAGELYIGGESLARGYLGRPGLSAERFVADPFGGVGARMYRTGDLVRWRSYGQVEYLGRVDDQVKVRGFRVELAEIQTALEALPGVAKAAVLVRQDGSGGKQIVGYVMPETGAQLAGAELRERVSARLPDYMVPVAVLVLETLPVNANGKLDRWAVPSPDLSAGRAWRAPRTPQEEVVCGMLAELLGVPRVGIDDDFFELGGNSLLAIHLINKLRATLNIEVDIRTVFDTPTVAGLAAAQRPASEPRPQLRRRVMGSEGAA